MPNLALDILLSSRHNQNYIFHAREEINITKYKVQGRFPCFHLYCLDDDVHHGFSVLHLNGTQTWDNTGASRNLLKGGGIIIRQRPQPSSAKGIKHITYTHKVVLQTWGVEPPYPPPPGSTTGLKVHVIFS